ncbi:YlxR family protein [Clostridiales bacterium BX7]|uniref:YlxR family protein n=2 Tax=Feifania hominis TaxID=2763660 RepID=A0A926DG24_9FIRM|nr:YlxR family protein [Feifania hominis]
MCLGCGEMLPKRELIRVVKSSEGEISLDVTGKKPGRGAYVCKKSECFAKMRKSRRLESKLAGAIPPEVYEKLEEELQQYE